jgi:hypothetical protein
MRILFGILILTVSGIACAQTSRQPFTVLIQCPQSEVKGGTEVRLLITVTNTSDQDVDLYKTPGPDGHAEDVNKIDVRDASGNLLKRADSQIIEIGGTQHTVPKRFRISRKGVILKPGESLEDFTILSNLFDLSKPGKYTVTAQNERRSGDSSHELKLIYVKSNTITITVTE